MTSCKHTTLELLPERQSTRRCRRCHLTLSAEELGAGFCPECFDSHGVTNYDFETLAPAAATAVRYRCEECGVVIATPNGVGDS